MEKNYGTNLSHSFPCFSNLLPGIGEFSTHGDIYFVCGKLSELHFDAKLSPNPGGTVLKCQNISWTQDLRVKHKGTVFIGRFWPGQVINDHVHHYNTFLITW